MKKIYLLPSILLISGILTLNAQTAKTSAVTMKNAPVLLMKDARMFSAGYHKNRSR